MGSWEVYTFKSGIRNKNGKEGSKLKTTIMGK
jgi:hypothetical protein